MKRFGFKFQPYYQDITASRFVNPINSLRFVLSCRWLIDSHWKVPSNQERNQEEHGAMSPLSFVPSWYCMQRCNYKNTYCELLNWTSCLSLAQEFYSFNSFFIPENVNKRSFSPILRHNAIRQMKFSKQALRFHYDIDKD